MVAAIFNNTPNMSHVVFFFGEPHRKDHDHHEQVTTTTTTEERPRRPRRGIDHDHLGEESSTTTTTEATADDYHDRRNRLRFTVGDEHTTVRRHQTRYRLRRPWASLTTRHCHPDGGGGGRGRLVRVTGYLALGGFAVCSWPGASSGLPFGRRSSAKLADAGRVGFLRSESAQSGDAEAPRAGKPGALPPPDGRPAMSPPARSGKSIWRSVGCCSGCRRADIGFLRRGCRPHLGRRDLRPGSLRSRLQRVSSDSAARP